MSHTPILSSHVTVNYGLKTVSQFILSFRRGYYDDDINMARNELVKRGYVKDEPISLATYCDNNNIILRAMNFRCFKGDVVEFGTEMD